MLGADSVEKHEPASDIDTAMVDSLKVLDLERPIREADSFEPRDGRPLRAHLAGSLLPAITPLTVLDHQGTSVRGLKNSTSR